jgi:hypothetical protein
VNSDWKYTENFRDPGVRFMAYYGLASEITWHHFYHSLFLEGSKVNRRLAQIQEEDDIQGWEAWFIGRPSVKTSYDTTYIDLHKDLKIKFKIINTEANVLSS